MLKDKEKLFMKRPILAMLLFFILFMLFIPTLLVQDTASNASILHVSIPAGEDRTGIPFSDPWLNECWFLNVTSSSGTFTIKIEDVSGNIFSYDTHLVIALNSAAYNNLVSLTVDNVTMVKNDFKYGRLRPYNLRNWPSGDVYPTWFNDTLVNVGTILPKGHVNATVSATFSNATGARIHFDVYGSKKPSPAPSADKLHLTRNPLSEDSTVVFWPPTLTSPVACFTVSDPRPQVFETVFFNASCSSDPDGWITNYTWNFGDGNITTVEYPNITHRYDVFGNLTVTLVVADNDGLTDNTSKSILVRAHPRADFTWLPLYPVKDQTVTFDASASTPNGGTILDYSWNFGDGTFGTGKFVTHTYSTEGTYTVTLNVTDSEGKWDTESKNITVGARPNADFSCSPPSPQEGEEATFDASPSTPNGGTIVSYEWDFGDLSPHKFGKIVTHVYATYGTYIVTLNVTDSEGKWDTESKAITIRAHPRADFTWLPLHPVENQTVTFDASASTPNGGTILDYSWNFGDGTFGTGKFVTHAYTTAGTYTVILTIIDSEDKLDVESKQIMVKSLHPPPLSVGGHATPISIGIEKARSASLLPQIGLFLALFTAITGIMLTKCKKRRQKGSTSRETRSSAYQTALKQ